MSPEEKLEMGRKLIDEAEAEIAAKKRNWREEAEPGMLFRSYGKVVAIPPRHPVDYAISMDPEHIGTPCYGWEEAKDLAYLGHARDLIKIADDAHEPTGAELVGKKCQFSDDGKNWTYGASKCGGYDESKGDRRYAQGCMFAWKYARLAR